MCDYLPISSQKPESLEYLKTDSGWMNCDCFLEWLRNVFVKYLEEHNIERPVLLFLDNHSSHISLDIHYFCREFGIIMCTLYPNSTFLMQPLDVKSFGVIKGKWEQYLANKKMENKLFQLKLQNFGQEFAQFWAGENFSKAAISGFKATGLYPWNENSVNYSELLKCCQLDKDDPRRMNPQNSVEVYVTKDWAGEQCSICLLTMSSILFFRSYP